MAIAKSRLYSDIITPLPVYRTTGFTGELWHRNQPNVKGRSAFSVPISQDFTNPYNEGFPIRFKAQGLASIFFNIYAVPLDGDAILLTATPVEAKYSYCSDGLHLQIVVDISDIPCGEHYFTLTSLEDERFYSEIFHIYQNNTSNSFGIYTFSRNLYDGILNNKFCKIGRFDYNNVFAGVPTGLTNYYYSIFLEGINGEEFEPVTEKETEENDDGTLAVTKIITKFKYTVRCAPSPAFYIKAIKMLEHLDSADCFVNDQLNTSGSKLTVTEINVTSEPFDDNQCYEIPVIEFVGDMIFDSKCCDDDCSEDFPCWSDDITETSCIIQTESGYRWELFFGDPCSDQWLALDIEAGNLVLNSDGNYYMCLGSNSFGDPNVFFHNININPSSNCTPVITALVASSFTNVIVDVSDNEVDWYYYASGSPAQLLNGLSGSINSEVDTSGIIYFRLRIGFTIPEGCTDISTGNKKSESYQHDCSLPSGFDYKLPALLS